VVDQGLLMNKIGGKKSRAAVPLYNGLEVASDFSVPPFQIIKFLKIYS
jgi:hypothetical protein